MEKSFDVMAAGHVCLDIIPEMAETGASSLAELIRPGKLVNVGAPWICTGGPVSNTGIALRKLGNRVCFSARVGDDAFGQLTYELLRANGHAEGIRLVEDSSSSYTLVIAPPRIDRVFLHNPGANNAFGPEDLPGELLHECRLFHFGYPPLMRRMYEDDGAKLAEVFRMAKDAGATTSCDMALPDPASEPGKAPWERILENVLPHVDIFLPSVEEAFFMLEPREFLAMKESHGGAELIDVLQPADYSRIAHRLLALGARAASLKCGHRGFYMQTGDLRNGLGAAKPGDAENWSHRELWAPAYRIEKLASATGSGDSSIAGFLSAYLRGENIERALRAANCLGWQNVQAMDALSGIKTWEETLALLDRGLPELETRLDSSEWSRRDELGLWTGPADTRT